MTLSVDAEEHFMKAALKEAEKAYDADEVPVGAVIVANERIIARAHNLTERLNDATAHAEMQVFTAASDYLGGKFLDACTLYVTLEPCVMCAGAAYWTRIGRLVFGAADEKAGYRRVGGNLLHPRTALREALLKEPCGELLTDYFRSKRKG